MIPNDLMRTMIFIFWKKYFSQKHIKNLRIFAVHLVTNYL